MNKNKQVDSLLEKLGISPREVVLEWAQKGRIDLKRIALQLETLRQESSFVHSWHDVSPGMYLYQNGQISHIYSKDECLAVILAVDTEARELLVKAYAKHPVAKDIAEAFSISVSGVYRLVRQKARTGSVALRVSQRGRKKLLNDDDIRIIKEQIEAHNDITIGEIREALGQKASYTTVERAVNGLGYTIKKKSLHASERDRARCTGKTYSVEGTIGRG